MRSFLYILFIASILTVGCSAQNREESLAGKVAYGGEVNTQANYPAEAADASAKAALNEPQLASRQQSVIRNRMVIRTASVTLRVDSVEKSEKSVQKIVNSFGGYVDTATSSDLDSDHPSLTLSMRIPAQSFDAAMSQLEALGVRTSKNITSQDVTEQVVDMDARLKSMLAQEETYRALLRSTRRLEDVITLQQQLTDVRGAIESLAGQRKSLATQAALSTISLTLTQSAIANQPPKDPNWLAQAWAEATTQVGGVFRSLAVFAIWLVLFSWAWAPLVWLVWRAAKAAQPKAA